MKKLVSVFDVGEEVLNVELKKYYKLIKDIEPKFDKNELEFLIRKFEEANDPKIINRIYYLILLNKGNHYIENRFSNKIKDYKRNGGESKGLSLLKLKLMIHFLIQGRPEMRNDLINEFSENLPVMYILAQELAKEDLTKGLKMMVDLYPNSVSAGEKNIYNAIEEWMCSKGSEMLVEYLQEKMSEDLLPYVKENFKYWIEVINSKLPSNSNLSES